MSADNVAFVFIKPHAVTEKTKALVKEQLAAKKITILEEGSISSEDIDKNKLIDQHYYAIASKATILTPDKLNVPADKFQEKFGVSWADTLAAKKASNAMDACKTLGLDADGLELEWRKAETKSNVVKFGGGFYCGLIEVDGKEPLYVFNAFFMSMRGKFTVPGESIYYYTVAWNSKDLPWAEFRGQLLGPTDPAAAPADSVRGKIFAQWKELGLKEVPNKGENGVHASASPFEGLAERLNWRQGKVADDSFGKALVGGGISEETIKAWSVDPQVALSADSKGSLFDALEDLDFKGCLEKCVELNKLSS